MPLIRIHEVTAAREKVDPGKCPVLGYTDGTHHVLLPSGQRINPDKKNHLGVSGKALRRARIKAAAEKRYTPTT